MNCFCANQYSNLNFKVKRIRFRDGESYCDSWLEKQSEQTAFVFLVSIAITIANFLFEKVLELIAKFERPHTKTAALISNIMKIFVVEYINTAVIILLMNMQLNVKIFDIPVIAGKYSEFSTDWYRMVGSTIVLTMIIRIMTS